jgi:hypothetical protein
MASTIHISAQGDEPIKTVKRQEGKYNFGLYCSRCTQFFALAVLNDPPVGGAEFKSDGEPLFACPFCHHRQRRQVSEIVQLFLVRGKKRTPSIPLSPARPIDQQA